MFLFEQQENVNRMKVKQDGFTSTPITESIISVFLLPINDNRMKESQLNCIYNWERLSTRQNAFDSWHNVN